MSHFRRILCAQWRKITREESSQDDQGVTNSCEYTAISHVYCNFSQFPTISSSSKYIFCEFCEFLRVLASFCKFRIYSANTNTSRKRFARVLSIVFAWQLKIDMSINDKCHTQSRISLFIIKIDKENIFKECEQLLKEPIDVDIKRILVRSDFESKLAFLGVNKDSIIQEIEQYANEFLFLPFLSFSLSHLLLLLLSRRHFGKIFKIWPGLNLNSELFRNIDSYSVFSKIWLFLFTYDSISFIISLFNPRIEASQINLKWWFN